MKPALKILLWIVALLLLAAFSWATVLYLEWPIWGAFAIFFGVIAAFYAFKFWRRIWIVTRSRIKLAQSEIASKQILSNEKQSLATLTDKWHGGIAQLRDSTLRRFGNPMYVLPWYLVIGESGSGKTSAIAASGLGSFIQNTAPTNTLEPTRNCEWWFFNKAVVIDTAGRYVSPNGTLADQAEWEKLLDLLSRSRFREGIDGLVVTIDADRLLANQPDVLESEGRQYRNRIEQLIRLFDKRFPVYLLVTKADRIYGFDEFASALNDNTLHQALGYIGTAQEGDGAEVSFLNAAMAQIQSRLKQLRLAIGLRSSTLDAGLLLFTEEVEKVGQGLQVFINACFGNTPYMEQPLLRGLFFSSSQQPGGALSSVLDSFPGQERLVTGKRSLFLQDLFGKILPKDRAYYMPTRLVNRWRLMTRNLAAIGWVSFFAAASVFVVMSYVKTVDVIDQIDVAFPNEQVLNSNNRDDQALVLIKMKEVVDLILLNERGWSTRWLAFSPAIKDLESKIKASYVARVQAFISTGTPFYDRYQIVLAKPDSVEYYKAADVVSHLVNLYQSRINGADYQELQLMPDIPLEAATANDFVMARVFGQNYDHMFKAFLAWQSSNSDFLRYVLGANREALTHFVFDPPQMEFLLNWADAQAGVNEVRLKDFWLPSYSGTVEMRIRPALTRAGNEKIVHFLDRLQKAFNDSPEFLVRRAAFERWYRAERINAWKNFAWEFSNGQELLATEHNWRDVLTRLNTINSPYIQFLDRLNTEFADMGKDELPNWLVFARDVDQIGHQARLSGVFQNANVLMAAINRVGGKSIKNSFESGQNMLPNDVSNSIAAVNALRKYRGDFDLAVAEAAGGEGRSLQLISDLYGIGIIPDVKSSMLETIYESFVDFQKKSGYNSPDDQVVWQLVRGPFDMLVRYSQEQASCALQKSWEKDVVLRSQMTTSEKELSNQLYGKDGSVWAFVDGPAKPFILQRSQGFLAAKVQEFSFPFMPDFIPYLNRSMSGRVEQLVREQRAELQKGKSVKMTIAPRPVGVNPGAKVKPYAAILTLQCASGEVIINNFNTASKEVVAWSPETCGDTALQIKIENLTLTRRYPGPLGFARFVSDFSDGERRFTPLDFPSVKSKLDGLGVKVISVPYDFSGANAVLQLAEDMSYLQEQNLPATLRPLQAKKRVPVPERISQCWASGGAESGATSLSVLMDQKAQVLLEEQLNPVSKAEVANKPTPKPAVKQHVSPAKKKIDLAKPVTLVAASADVPEPSIYFVEVGVFNAQSNVTAARKQLANLRFDVTEEPMSGEFNGSIRVMAGPFMSKESANKALNRLSMMGVTGVVVKR